MTEAEQIKSLKDIVKLLTQSSQKLIAIAETAPHTPENYDLLFDANRYSAIAKEEMLKHTF